MYENKQELLKLAAFAASLDFDTSRQDKSLVFTPENKQEIWNPLGDDGDAHRLAVKLQIWLDYSGCDSIGPSYIKAKYLATLGRRSSCETLYEYYVPESMFTSLYYGDIEYARYQVELGTTRGIEQAVRNAIVKAAADIGKLKREKT